MSAFIIVRFVFILGMLLLLLADIFLLEVHWVYYFTPTLIFIGLLAAGSAIIKMNFFLKATSSLDSSRKFIALTFDDGPSAIHTPLVLDLLEQYNAKATFFCIGRRMEENKALVKCMLAKGHSIGNHSYSHSYFFSLFRKKEIVEEIRKTNAIIQALSGQDCRIFRPPYGVTNPPIAKAVKESGQAVIGWNLRSFDTSTKDYTKVVNRVISRIRPGAVILLHDDRPNCPKILEAILLYARENGYEFAQVS